MSIAAEAAVSGIDIEKKPQTVAEKFLAIRKERREEERETWNAYWKLRDLHTKGSIFPRIQYWSWRLVDAPATWWREKVVEPLNDKYKRPYYHRKYSRAPYLDECGIYDFACIFEANNQYRIDKLVDQYILDILRRRWGHCVTLHNADLSRCIFHMEDYEEAELNFFIKYGELGENSDVRQCYMKQKHRMVWERRHPEVMAERQRLYEEHKSKLAQGEYDGAFWKLGLYWQDKTRYLEPYRDFRDKGTLSGDRATSKDWEYYKKRQQDPEYDKEQQKKDKSGVFYYW